MVKLSVLPDFGTIRALKKKVDFYDWKGIHVARTWPRKPRNPLGPAAIQQQRWLQESNRLYRTCSLLVRDEMRWYVGATSWTPRDMFMSYYFGKYASPYHTVTTPDPNPPPYPIPDPNHHYGTIRARQQLTFPGPDPRLRAVFTETGPWTVVTSFAEPTHTWSERYRYGHTYPTTPAWKMHLPVTPTPLHWEVGDYYHFHLAPLLPLTGERWLFFYFFKATGLFSPHSRGHSPLYGLRLYPLAWYVPGFSGHPGGLLHAHGPRRNRPFLPFFSSAMFPPPVPRTPFTNYPIPPGPLHIPPS